MAVFIRLVMILWVGSLAQAQTLVDFDYDGAAGIFVKTGGTWDFNNTVNWSADNGTNRTPWTDNGNIARIQFDKTYSWDANTTMTVSTNNGTVGAMGVQVTGSQPGNSKNIIVTGHPLRIGGDGVTYGSTNSSQQFQMNAPAVLTASQTWQLACPARIYNGGLFSVSAAISSLAGTTALTLDGNDRIDPAIVGGNDSRVGFAFNRNNAYSGATTVSGGAFLWLNYGTENGSKLDDGSPLKLHGGAVYLQGGSTNSETVGSLSVDQGASYIGTGSSGGPWSMHLGTVSHTLGGTINFSASASLSLYTTSQNASGMIGGWATMGGTTWATGSVDGAETKIGGEAGTWMSGGPSTWTAGQNVDARGGTSALDENLSINALRLYTATAQDLGAFTLTISSGGLISGFAGNRLIGGQVRSGLATGELFVHTPNDLVIDSVITDNDSVPTVLVKGGIATNTLTLTASNTYSGATYVNSGTLQLTNKACIAGTVFQAGGTTLDVRNGGGLEPGGGGGATLTLNGNLRLEDGAVLTLQLGDVTDLIRLTNPYATVAGATTAGGITLKIMNGSGIAKGVYTLMQWTPGTTLSGLELSDFTVTTPTGVEGTLQFGTNSLEFKVTAIPSLGTVISVASANPGGSDQY